ncbi:MAG: NnrS family protein [Planctomycetota bacterium]|nr:NnrS family protein [Planctomycetota bacterium]
MAGSIQVMPEEASCEGPVGAGDDLVPPALDDGAPLWRREPYRLLFPLGVVLGWVGVAKWLLLATAGVGTFSSADHAIAQVQGFMMCFAAGFLLTAIPRRTGSAPASAGVVLVVALAPTLTTIAAVLERFAWSQAAWLVLVATLVGFVVRRLRGGAAARRRPPVAFVWVPLSFLMGLAGSLLMAFRALGPEWRPLHTVGKGLLVQGMFVGLILGVGSMVIPLITRATAPPDASPRDRLALGGHLLGALLLAGSFVVEEYVDARAGLGLRGLVALVVLVGAARLVRRPTVPGLHRWLVWLGAWCVPLGLLLAAAFPSQRTGALHLVFLGGFATLAFAVAVHVTLAHAGDERLLLGRPWQVVALGLLLVAALAFRLGVSFDPARLWLWLGLSSVAFLLATAAWIALAAPRLLREA